MATIQLTFYINLTDQAQVTALQAQYPNGVSRGPLPAATEFSAPFIADGAAVTYPCTRTGWLPSGGSGVFPLDRAFFTISDGFWGHLLGRSQKYAWIGQFNYVAATGVTPPVTPGNMRQVVFAEGFEQYPVGSTSGAEGSTSDSANHSRDASRTPDGLGLAIRNTSAGCTHQWSTFGFVAGDSAWERFYIRRRASPTTDTGFWTANVRMNGATLETLVLSMNNSGGLGLHGSPITAFFGTSDPLELNRWYLIDVVYQAITTDTGPEPSSEDVKFSASVYIDHVLAISGIQRVDSVVDPPAFVVEFSTMAAGQVFTGTNGLELDVDDWIGFDNGARSGPDWTHGHHIAYLEPNAFDATHSVNWAGDVRGLTQRGTNTGIDDVLTSSTASALLAANVRPEDAVLSDGVLGVQAFLVSILNRRATAGNGQLGYTFKRLAADAGTTTMATITQIATATWGRVLYNPSGESVPFPLASLMLRYTKAADVNLTTIQGMFATVVLVGVFDNCDRYPAVGEPPESISPSAYGVHNAPYPRTPWNRTAVPPDSPVWVKGGTYVGNNLGQDIIAKIPAHFFWVRNITTAVGAWKWWSSMVAAKWAIAGDHRGGMEYAREDPDYVSPGGATDPETRSMLRIGGAATAANATANTYQYIAIGDPGARFMLNGVFQHVSALADADNALTDPDFLPEAGFFSGDYPAGGGALWFKGPGHATPNGQQLAVGEVATFGDFSVGSFHSRASLHTVGVLSGVSYSMWRQRDGADYATFGITEPIVVQIMSYTGDGAASRTIALPRASGKRPLWALAVSHSGASWVRDPSHLTNTSSTTASGSTTIATGFTAGGVDSVTVGSSLNANGVVFELFVIMAADATAGNGGWGTNGEVLYDPIPAPGGQWPDGYTQPELDALEAGDTDDGLDSFDDGPNLADDLADALCVPFTLRVCNMALSRIGHSKLFSTAADITALLTQEAKLVNAFYETCIRATLRDFPWNHAKRYANLSVLAGSDDDPVNSDWIYTFRAPTGMVFARRIVRTGSGRKYDPAPPPFEVSSDDTGPIIYANSDGIQYDDNDEPFIELEYTVRPNCAGKAAGDQLFVSAAAWNLGRELSSPLAKDKAEYDKCDKGYAFDLKRAEAASMKERQQEPDGDASWIRAMGADITDGRFEDS